MTGKKLALVIGATGGIGGAVAERLAADDWAIRALHRDPAAAAKATGRDDYEWVQGDAMVEAEVARAAEGVDLVVHGANPPGYRNWAGLQLPMLDAAITGARAAGARLVFPGTVYNYGPDAFPILTEVSAQTPVTRKGAIRVRMEQALAGAAEGGLKVLIVRCGDFFGPRPSGSSWLSQAMVKPGKPVTSVTYPGSLSVAHGWAYLPDVAETVARLVALDDLADFEMFHLRFKALTGAEMVAALEAAAGRRLSVQTLPWFAIRGLSSFNETFREMLEMRYLWETPVLMDNARLVARLGEEPHTPIVDALRAALAGLNALPRQPEAMAA